MGPSVAWVYPPVMVSEPSASGFGTRAIKAATHGPRVDQTPGAVPIYQAATFHGEDVDDLAAILSLEKPGYAYSRIDNPTAAALGSAFATMHEAEAGFAFGSGMAAIHATMLSLVSAGDRIVCTSAVYGSTRALLDGVFARLGVNVAYVDATDLTAVAEAVAASPTRLVYAETISNPTLAVPDLGAIADLAHAHGAMFVVDNTFASPYLSQPLELGVDLVVESATKWLGGHSDVIAGVVAGRRELIDAIAEVATDTGGIAAPMSAFLVLRGIQTLHVRMDRHSESALKLARHLEGRPAVRRSIYPGLPSHPQADIAQRELRAGGGICAIELADRESATAFIDGLAMPPATATLGSVLTYVVHPPSSTHRQLDDAALAKAGIPSGLVRFSVGLEDIEDLIADVDQALASSTRARIGA